MANDRLLDSLQSLWFRCLTEGTLVKLRHSIPRILGALLIALQSAMAAYAAPAAKETQVLERVNVNGTNREMGMGVSEFPPGAEKPRHMATGPEVCYVTTGEIILQVEGRTVKVIRAGGSFQIPANAIHVTKAGPEGATVIATWVSTPGKPFNVSVPQ
jgi:quercetin dioxygenase-like cupin family protein